MALFEIGLFIGGGFVVFFLLYRFVYKRLQSKNAGLRLRILLFEQIGKDIVFLRQCFGEEKPDAALGVYIFIEGEKKNISDVANSDLFYDQRMGKCLMVCKYADDDYRVMSRLKQGHWFKKVMVERDEVDAFGVPVLLDEVNEFGHTIQVPKKVLVEELVPYVEPVGISQEGREVMRFNREFHKRMAERRAEKAGFWSKYGSTVMVAAMLVIILMSTAYNANKFETSAKHLAAAFGESADEYIAKVDNPSWVEGLFNAVERRAANAGSPPS